MSRTIMLDELQMLFDFVDQDAFGTDYLEAITESNCLRKNSQSARKLTHRDLVKQYSLSPEQPIFRTFRAFWGREEENKALLALIASHSRDAMLKATTSYILNKSEGSPVSTDSMAEELNNLFPDRFSTGTSRSLARNLNSSWTKSGHLFGRNSKVRAKARATEACVAFSLFLNFLEGERGMELFHTSRMKLLDCSPEKAMELAEGAARKGWIVLKRVSDVVEVQFPGLLTPEEEAWLRE